MLTGQMERCVALVEIIRILDYGRIVSHYHSHNR